jgi:hypothetical protein
MVAAVVKRFEERGAVTVSQVAVIVVGLLLSASITEWIGIHSIFGAFLFGVIMPHGSRMSRELTDKIEDFTVIVLLPLFFVSAGLRTNLFSLDSPQLALWTVAVTAAAIVGKLAGCGIAARLTGYSSRDAFAVGTLMNTRGLTELVILTVGLNLGVLSDRTFAMMVIMALVTTFMAAPLIERVMPHRQMIRVLAGGIPAQLAYRVLVELEDIAAERTLVDSAVLLTGGRRPAELVFAHLLPTARAPEFRLGLSEDAIRQNETLREMQLLAERLSAPDVTARMISFLSNNVARDLTAIVETQNCNALLVPWSASPHERVAARAYVHQLLKLVPRDVVILADRRGDGIRRDRGPVVAVLGVERENEGVSDIAAAIADSAGTTHQALLYRESGSLSEILRASTTAMAMVVGVDRVIPEDADFGAPADALVASADCPVLVVRPAAVRVSIRPSNPALTAPGLTSTAASPTRAR